VNPGAGRRIACPTGKFEARTIMDLRAHYQKIRELERSFEAGHAVIVSVETPEGGKAGVKTEVPAHVAAKMIVEGRARAASELELTEFGEQKSEAKRIADQLDTSRRLQVTVVSENDLRALKESKRSGKH
jgi:hypothetical protein